MRVDTPWRSREMRTHQSSGEGPASIRYIQRKSARRQNGRGMTRVAYLVGTKAKTAARRAKLGVTLLVVLGFAAQGSAHAQSLSGSTKTGETGGLANPSAWKVVPSANASPGNNLLTAVASVSAGDVWAVGSADDARGNSQPLREHWNGSAWTVVAGPNNFDVLKGVAAVSPGVVWAVGQGLDGAAIERWNGLAWRAVKNPAAGPQTTLNGVATAPSGDVWAVGTDFHTGTARTFIEHRDVNTTRWSVVPSPNASAQNNLLVAVAAVSASNVWAVGDFQNDQNVFQTLIEHWDGTAWRIVHSPSGSGIQAGLLSVAALSGTNVWAAGNSGTATLIEHWDGTRWTVVPSPTPDGTSFNPVFGLAPVSGHNIWAVGQTQNGTSGTPATLIEHWNGASWNLVASPSPGTQATLMGAAADRSSGHAWAVGNFTHPVTGAQRTLTEFNP